MGDTAEIRAGAAFKQKLEQLASEHGTTLYTVLMAAFQTLLSRYSGQDDIIVGSSLPGSQGLKSGCGHSGAPRAPEE
ncbi:condensation domain-containing protein [Bacillus sonorensis]|nr:condensation domain-containing protein [Bacillus sonorensis]